MVIYENPATGGQCGGTSSKQSGVMSNMCLSLSRAAQCFDFEVGSGFTRCRFDPKKSSCNDPPVIEQTVNGGQDSNGVSLDTQVYFVEVECDK